jgi:hypothetical protein
MRAWWALGLIVAFAGCKEKPAPSRESVPAAREAALKVGDMQVTAFLDREDGAYSLEEDIILNVTLENPTDEPMDIPHLPGHPSTWSLKDRKSDSVRTVAYRPAAQPGVPFGMEIAPNRINPGTRQVYTLPMKEYLGPLESGRYSLQYRLDSDFGSFTLGWLDFEIVKGSISAFSLQPSNPGHAEESYLAWIDDGVVPGRIFLRRTPIARNRNLGPWTTAIAAADSGSVPVVSTASGETASVPWVAWLADGKVQLARPDLADKIKKLDWTPQKPGPWSLAEALVASGTWENPEVTGVLTRTEGGNLSILAFRVTGDSIAWTEGSAPAGTLLRPPRWLAPNPGTRVLAWLEGDKGTNRVLLLPWTSDKGFGAPVRACEFLTDEQSIEGFTVTAYPGGLGCAIAVRGPDGLAVSTWALDPKTLKPRSPKANSWIFRPESAYSILDLALDSQGTSWVLAVGRPGCWVQSADWTLPTDVDDSEGATRARLFFKRGDLPKVLIAHPHSPFEIRPVAFPDGGDTSDDLVEDNQGATPFSGPEP